MTLALNLLCKAGAARYARRCEMLAIGVTSLPAVVSALAQQDPCAKFSWNLRHEGALCAESPQSLAAGREATSAPLPPGKTTLIDAAHAALARLQVRQSGVYRICVGQPCRIDVLADGKMIDTADFQGRAGCAAPHKSLHYSQPADRELVLQFSAAAQPHLRLTITIVD